MLHAKMVKLFQRNIYGSTLCQRAAAIKHGVAAHNFEAMKNTYESSWYETIS